MLPVPIKLVFGPRFQLLSRASLEGNTVRGQMDYPPSYQELSLADHNPGMQFLPALVTMSLMEQAIRDYICVVTGNTLFPRLTTMPSVEFQGMTRPGTIDVTASVQLHGHAGEAVCLVLVSGRKKATASFTFDLVREMASQKPSLELELQPVSIDRTGLTGSFSAVFAYCGNALIPFPEDGIPWPLILEGLGQCAFQIVHAEERLTNALLLVTHLEGTTFHRPCQSNGTVDLVTQVDWTDGRRRAIVHAAANFGGKLIVDGDFGLAVLTRR